MDMLEPVAPELLSRGPILPHDPLRAWLPHAKQREFLRGVLLSPLHEHWAFWANRAGKTIVGAACGSILARYGAEPLRPAMAGNTSASTMVWDRATAGWVVSLDFPSSRDVVQPKYFANGFVPAGGAEPFIPTRELAPPIRPGGIPGWSTGDQVLRLKNGSLIGFKSAASGRDKFQGVERDWVHFDEEPPYEIYSEATLRVGTRPLRVFGTCTLLPPEGQIGGVSWAFEKLIQPWQVGKLPSVAIYTASIYDNPYLPHEQVAVLEARYPEGSVERRIRLHGELLPGLAGSRAYAAFDPRLHVADPGPVEWRRPLCLCLDFNVSPLCALVGQRIHGLFVVHRELIVSEGQISDMAERFRHAYPSHGAAVHIYGDATGMARDVQTGRTDYQVLLNALKQYPVPIILKVPEVNPGVSARVNAVNRALLDEDGVVGVQIAPDCEELIKDCLGVLRDPRGGIRKTYNPRDPYFYRTHTSDGFGYWVCYEQPVGTEPLDPPKRPDAQWQGAKFHFPQVGTPRARQRVGR